MVLAMLLAGCGKPTGLVVVVHSDIANRLQEVELTAMLPSGEMRTQRIVATPTDFPVSHPIAYADDSVTSVVVEVTGFINGQPVIRDRVATEFIPDSVREVTLQLIEPCLGVMCPDAEQRCDPADADLCVDTAVSGSSLPQWSGTSSAPPHYCEATLFEEPLFSIYPLDGHCGGCGMACTPGATCAGFDASSCSSSPVQKIALGLEHACARHADDTVACWGSGSAGQLPGVRASTHGRSRPRPIVAARATDIWLGATDTCFIETDRTVVCAGRAYSEAGFFDVVEFPSFTKLALGDSYGCAIAPDTTLWCFGLSQDGETGAVGMTPSSGIMVPGLPTPVTDVSVYYTHTCAIANAQVYCWGDNEFEQLGPMGGDGGATPVPVPGIVNAAEVAVGVSSSCARMTAGNVQCWGDNEFGQLGRPGEGGPNPTDVVGVAGATRLVSGGEHVCILAGGQVACWGANTSGQLGVDPSMTVLGPTTLPTDAVDVALNDVATCVVTSAGGVRCFGSRAFGLMGDWSLNAEGSAFMGVDVIQP